MNNEVACGTGGGLCLFFIRVVDSRIAENRFVGGELHTGVHLQGKTDGDVIEDNVVVARQRSLSPSLGGIRVHTGRNVRIVGNEVRGPWRNSVATAHLSESTIAGNELRGATDNGITLFASPPDPAASEVEVLENEVTCGDGTCLFFSRVIDSRIADNRFTADGIPTGVHLQGKTDGDVVADNLIVAREESLRSFFGGIRVRDGEGLRVTGNEVRGPWKNAVAAANLSGSTIGHNELRAATNFGVFLAENPFQADQDIGGDDNLFRANRIHDAGVGGFLVDEACDNGFVGNRFPTGPTVLAAAFSERTGDNTFVGNGNRVADEGSRDCDGDGSPDPNQITGTGALAGGIDVEDLLPDSGPTGSSGSVLELR